LVDQAAKNNDEVSLDRMRTMARSQIWDAGEIGVLGFVGFGQTIDATAELSDVIANAPVETRSRGDLYRSGLDRVGLHSERN
jgi:hypothetical protein